MSEYPALTTLHDAWVGSNKKAPEAVRAFIELQAERALADDLYDALTTPIQAPGYWDKRERVTARHRKAREQ